VESDGTAKTVQISCPQVGVDYFRAMGVRMLQGRPFQASDQRPEAKVAIVDESFARRFLRGNPIGRRIRVGGSPEDDHEVIGVVASTRPLLLLQHDYPQVYTPLYGMRYLETSLVVAYSGPPAPHARALNALAPQLDREVSYSVKPIEENVTTALSVIRVIAGGVATLGALALLLACTGVYGVVAFTVGRRRREIGIRIALGGPGRVVMRLLVWQSLRPVIVGGVLGAAVAVGLGFAIRTMLYGVSPLDPFGFGAALVLLALVATLAAYVPASSALRVDPATALRHD
jgi:ABC-type antimicrobial peptide transport system permease subunit